MNPAPPMPPELAPFQTRWNTFADKIRARIKEVEAEANAAYKEVIAIDVLQGTGVNGVSNALKARLQGLDDKIDEAWSKLDGEMDNVEYADDRAASIYRAHMLSQKAAFEREVERITETIIVYGEAEAARALQAVAMKEADAPLACQQCGAPLKRPSWCDTVNVTCSSCRAVTTSTPGTAGMMFAKGSGAIALAFEAALPAWYAKLLTRIVPAALLPFNEAQVIMSQEDNTCDLTKFKTDFGWEPQPFGPTLRAYASRL